MSALPNDVQIHAASVPATQGTNKAAARLEIRTQTVQCFVITGASRVPGMGVLDPITVMLTDTWGKGLLIAPVMRFTACILGPVRKIAQANSTHKSSTGSMFGGRFFLIAALLVWTHALGTLYVRDSTCGISVARELGNG